MNYMINIRSKTEEFLDLVLIYLCTDYAELSCYISCTCSDICLAGYEVEVDPLAVLAGDDTLSTKDHAVIAVVELFKCRLDAVLCEGS